MKSCVELSFFDEKIIQWHKLYTNDVLCAVYSAAADTFLCAGNLSLYSELKLLSEIAFQKYADECREARNLAQLIAENYQHDA